MKNLMVLVLVFVAFAGCRTNMEKLKEVENLSLKYVKSEVIGVPNDVKDARNALRDSVKANYDLLKEHYGSEGILVHKVLTNTFRTFLKKKGFLQAKQFIDYVTVSQDFSFQDKKELILQLYTSAFGADQMDIVGPYIGEGWLPLDLEMDYAKKRIAEIQEMRGSQLIEASDEYVKLKRVFSVEEWSPSTDPVMFSIVFALIKDHQVDVAVKRLFYVMHVSSVENEDLQRYLAKLPSSVRLSVKNTLLAEEKRSKSSEKK